jgi:hypothetical protein
MSNRLLFGSVLFGASLWASAASACLSPPPERPVPREAGESDTAYQQRMVRLRAEAEAAAQVRFEEWAIRREEGLWTSANVTRIAVVDVAQIPVTDGPPSMTNDFVFSVVTAERGMERAERFTLTENRFWTNPCIPVVHYPVGQRYILFASDGPISRQSAIFMLLPVQEVRTERSLALLRAAEQVSR